MKSLYIKNIAQKIKKGQRLKVLGWVKAVRKHKKIIFLDLVDSTGSIQVVVNKEAKNSELFEQTEKVKAESSIRVKGVLLHSSKKLEIQAHEIEIMGENDLELTPQPRSNFDLFHERFTDLTLRKRHLYLRNEKFIAILRVRHSFFLGVHEWFKKNEFTDIHTPLLTQIPLYEEKTAFQLVFFEHKVFLTQCSAFYLESAVHALEKVYNIGPSFRAEESKSKRHLAEYWHLKAELAFADLEDIISFAEKTVVFLAKWIDKNCKNELRVLETNINLVNIVSRPYPRITYKDACKKLRASGKKIKEGQSLGSDEVEIIAKKFRTPFWVTGLPRSVEPFPYIVDKEDPTITRTADLILPGRSGGELLGVAEKIANKEDFMTRIKEKNKRLEDGYQWYYELRQLGSVPHSGMGMGVERAIKWLLQLNHVRDVIPFPRIFRRAPYP